MSIECIEELGARVADDLVRFREELVQEHDRLLLLFANAHPACLVFASWFDFTAQGKVDVKIVGFEAEPTSVELGAPLGAAVWWHRRPA